MDPFENIKLSFNCPKRLDELQACGGAWSCASCEKMVYDFRGMNEVEILDVFLQSGQQLCGVYDADRLRVLPQQPKWYKWLSAAMVMLGISTISQASFAQQSNTIMGKVAMPATAKDSVQKVLMGDVVILPAPRFSKGYAGLQQYLLMQSKNPDKFAGIVTASFTVEKDGKISDIKIISSGGQMLDESFIKALKKSKTWIPSTHQGERFKTTSNVSVDFSK